MLPPMLVGTPAVSRMWWMSAVVVLLPLVPVIPTTLCGGSSDRARAKSSMSPMISSPAARARAASGWVLRGTPGERMRLSKGVRSREVKSSTTNPFVPSQVEAPDALSLDFARDERTLCTSASRASSRSSHAVTRAPLASSAATVASPLRARP